MSDFDELIADNLPKQTSAPDPVPAPAPPQYQPQQPYPAVATDPAPHVYAQKEATPRGSTFQAWLAAGFAFIAVMFFMLWISTWVIIPIPGPGPHVDPIDGAFAAIFYDDKDKNEYSQDAINAMDSVDTAKFLDEATTGWKKIDVDDLDDLKNLHPIYAEMAGMDRPRMPWMVVRSGRRTGSEQITTEEELKSLVNRTIK